MSISIPERLVRTCVGWNPAPWTRALRGAIDFIGLDRIAGRRVLEVGAGSRSTLAPIFSFLGAEACAGYYSDPPGELLRNVEREFGLQRIETVRIDALDPPSGLPPADLVVLKSVLGGLSQNGDLAPIRRALEQLRSLAGPDALLLTMDNARSTALHMTLRRRFGAGRTGWSYFTLEEYRQSVLGDACAYFDAHGFFSFADLLHPGLQRCAAAVDGIIEPLVSPSRRAVFAAVLRARAQGTTVHS